MVIVVAGKAQDVGKSTLICQIIRQLSPDVSVIKSSLKDHLTASLVTNAPEIVGMADTDTGRFLASGAKDVVYLKTTYDQLAVDWQRSLGLVADATNLIVEGNSVVEYVQPDLLIYLDRKGVEAKPSARNLWSKADLIVDSDQFFASVRGETEWISALSWWRLPLSIEKQKLVCRILGLNRDGLDQIQIIDPKDELKWE